MQNLAVWLLKTFSISKKHKMASLHCVERMCLQDSFVNSSLLAIC